MQILSDLSHLAGAKAVSISRPHVLGQSSDSFGKLPFQFIDLLPENHRSANALRSPIQERGAFLDAQRVPQRVIYLADVSQIAKDLFTRQ